MLALQRRGKNLRYVGLDVGTKTLGVAVSDADHTLASPFKTLSRGKFNPLMDALKTALEEYDVGAFVIGLPLNMDGTEGPKCQSVRDFEKNLRRAFPSQDMFFWDERLTTVAAEGLLYASGVKATKHKKAVDKIAASLILQGFLDALPHK